MSGRRVRLQIFGRVQGVFFRESARREAIRLGVHGWIRNREDGTVEAQVEGKPDAVEAMIAWCRQGPPAAEVEQVAVTDAPPGEPLGTFRVEH